MTQKPEALKILAGQGATIAITGDAVKIDCNNREDAEAIFEWIVSLCKIEVLE